MKAVLATSVFGFSMAQLGTLSPETLEQWQDRFQEYKQIWETKGFIAMIMALLHSPGGLLRTDAGTRTVSSQPVLFHDPDADLQLCMDLRSTDYHGSDTAGMEKSQALYTLEEKVEQRRLLYVALTRASAMCRIFWYGITSFSALVRGTTAQPGGTAALDLNRASVIPDPGTDPSDLTAVSPDAGADPSDLTSVTPSLRTDTPDLMGAPPAPGADTPAPKTDIAPPKTGIAVLGATKGFVKGFIDLVVRGRYYIIDYKSNFLGDTYAEYSLSAITAAMEDHHYILQYHLYVMALYRYLSLRCKDYDHDRDFGGVLYLFIRGMHPDLPGSGVFFDRPPQALIQKMMNHDR